MKGNVPDPFAFVGALVEPYEGLAEVEKIRRGAFVLATAPRPPVGLTPHTIVHTHDKLVVRYYAPTGDYEGDGDALPVALIPSLINRAYVLDLEPGRSVVEALAAKGHPTYLVDWGVPGPEDAAEDVAYVLLDLLHRSIERICRHAGTKQAHVFGYCQGGTLAAMYSALRPERVASLCLLAAPAKFSEGGRFRDLVLHLDVDEAIDGDGLVPIDVLKPAFRLLDPMGNWTKNKGVDAASKDHKRLASTLAREVWLDDTVPMTGAFAREFVKMGYHEDRLTKGTWEVRGEPVLLSSITCRTLVVACDGDFISPKEAVLPMVDAIGANAKSVTLPTGHIGVVVSSAGPKLFYPLLDRWFRGIQPE